MRKKNNIWGIGFLVGISTLLAVAIGELILTALNKPPLFRYYTRALDEVQAGAWADWWVYRPNRGVYFNRAALTVDRIAQLTSVSPNWARLRIINSGGYHDADEFKAVDGNSAWRILFLGDSFTWGASADIGHSFVEIVESQIKAQYRGSQIWNAAIPAIGTEQAGISALELVPVMQAHTVILGLYENDLTDNLFPLDRFVRTLSGVAIAQYRWDQEMQKPSRIPPEQIVDNLRSRVEDRESGIYGIFRIANMVRALWPDLSRRGPQSVIEQKLIKTRFYLKEINRFCLEQGADFLVLLIPSRQSATQNPTVEYEALKHLLISEDIRLVSVREILRPEHYASLPDNHWNNEGHKVAAMALIKFLETVSRLRDRVEKPTLPLTLRPSPRSPG